MVRSGNTVIRRLFILIFVLSAVGNSLAAVLPYIEGDSDCEARCCRSARHNESRASLSKLCCLTECNQPAEAPGVPESTSFSSARVSKDLGSPAGIETTCAAQTFAFLHSPPSNLLHSTDIYLKTGALLI